MSANITDPVVKQFSDDYVRTLATNLTRVYLFSKQLLARARALDIRKVVPDDAGASLIDGSPANGRPAISAVHVLALVERAEEVVNWFEAEVDGQPEAVLTLLMEVVPDAVRTL